MPTQPRHPRRSAAEWSALLERWKHSGQDLHAFARRHRVSKRSLMWWRWRLRSNPPPLDFVALVPAPSPTRDTAADLDDGGNITCTIDTDDGRRLTLTGPRAFLVDVISTALARGK